MAPGAAKPRLINQPALSNFLFIIALSPFITLCPAVFFLCSHFHLFEHNSWPHVNLPHPRRLPKRNGSFALFPVYARYCYESSTIAKWPANQITFDSISVGFDGTGSRSRHSHKTQIWKEPAHTHTQSVSHSGNFSYPRWDPWRCWWCGCLQQ